MKSKLQAYLRKVRMDCKKNDRETFLNDIFNSMERRLTPEEFADAMECLNSRMLEKLNPIKDETEVRYLHLERATDKLKMNLIR